MAHIAVKGFGVLVEVVVQQASAVVGLTGMALPAGDDPFGNGNRRASTADFVVSGFMAFATGKIIAAHVDVTHPVRLEQLS